MEGPIIGLMLIVLVIGMTVYLVKRAPKVWAYLKRKKGLSDQRKLIMIQNHLLESRGAELLALGYDLQRNSQFGLHFVKPEKEIILEDQLRGWSDAAFNSAVYGAHKKS